MVSAAAATTARYLLKVAYNGGAYSGWQINPGVRTIAGSLTHAAQQFIGFGSLGPGGIAGSSRTDAGVHAFANTCHVDLRRVDRRGAAIAEPHSARTVLDGLNYFLRRDGHHDIGVVAARRVSPDFHARHGAIGRTYKYYIVDAAAPVAAAPPVEPEPVPVLNGGGDRRDGGGDGGNDGGGGGFCYDRRFVAAEQHTEPRAPPSAWLSHGLGPAPFFDAPFCWFLPGRHLDPAAMEAALSSLEGEHDFSSFRSAGCQAASPVKTMHRAALEVLPGGGVAPGTRRMCVTLHATGFLYHQVRNIVGALVSRVGVGKWTPGDFREFRRARSRALDGPLAAPELAPAAGLFLDRVHYDPLNRRW